MSSGLIFLFAAGLFVLIIAVPALLFLRVRRFSSQKIAEANRLEAQGRYAEACFQYAFALLNNVSRPAERKEKIRQLWQTYGPFDYSTLLAQLASGDTPAECDPQVCLAILELIESLVGERILPDAA